MHAGLVTLHARTGPRACARKHTLTHIEISNPCCFSTATMVSWTRLIVTLYVHCLSCFSLLTEFQNFTPTDGLCLSSHTGWISGSFGHLPLACPPYHARTSPTNTNTNTNAHQQLVTDDLLYNITCTSSTPSPNKSLQLAFIMTSFVWLQSQSVSQPEIAILAHPG